MSEALSVEDDVELVIGGTGLIALTAAVADHRELGPVARDEIASENLELILRLRQERLLLDIQGIVERLTSTDVGE